VRGRRVGPEVGSGVEGGNVGGDVGSGVEGTDGGGVRSGVGGTAGSPSSNPSTEKLMTSPLALIS